MVKDQIKGLLTVTIGSIAMGAVGGASSLGTGISSATQTLIGGGMLGSMKKIFKL